MNDKCIEAFRQKPTNESFASYIDRMSPDCGCENHRVSTHCDKPVTSDETLVRLVVDPIHIVQSLEGTRLQSSFLNIACTSGASCLRDGAAELEYQETARLIISGNPTTADGSPRKIYGVVKIPAALVQNQRITVTQNGSIRGFCIYATGDHNRPHHADIVVNGIVHHRLTRSQQNRAAEKLSKAIACNIITVKEFQATADLSAWA
jgi:hypothetical protein